MVRMIIDSSDGDFVLDWQTRHVFASLSVDMLCHVTNACMQRMIIVAWILSFSEGRPVELRSHATASRQSQQPQVGTRF